LESPSPEPVYQLGLERISPFTCPGIFLFIDYICLLCCFSNWCEHTLCKAGAVFLAALPLSGRQALCRVLYSSLLGPAGVRGALGDSGRTGVALDTDWWAFLSRDAPGWSGWSSRCWVAPKGIRDGASAATWCPPGLSHIPSWSGETPVNPGASPGVALAFTATGSR